MSAYQGVVTYDDLMSMQDEYLLSDLSGFNLDEEYDDEDDSEYYHQQQLEQQQQQSEDTTLEDE